MADQLDAEIREVVRRVANSSPPPPDFPAERVASQRLALLAGTGSGDEAAPTEGEVVQVVVGRTDGLRAGRRTRGPLAALVAASLVLLIGLGSLLLVDSSKDAQTPVAERPSTTLTTLLTTSPTVPVITLGPAADYDPVRVSTVIGDLVFTSLQFPPDHEFYMVAATPYGPVAIDDGALRWSADGGVTWEGVRSFGAWVAAVGNDVIVYGQGFATRYSWDGNGWAEVAQLDLASEVDDIAFGPRGAVAVRNTTIWYSSDGMHFTQAEQGPSKDLLAAQESPTTTGPETSELAGGCPPTGSGVGSIIGAVLATDDGFVALTPANPDDWNDSPICEPVLWFSTDGNVWELLSNESPFGETAFVRSDIWNMAYRDGRFVAAGGIGEQGAVWVSNDGLTWEQADVALDFAGTVTVGDLGWILTGVVDTEDASAQHMWFSVDGLTWDGPYERPDGLATGYLPPQLAIGTDSIFGVGGRIGAGGRMTPVVALLQD